MTYSIRRMVKEDLDQVTEIDREAFPTQWPPANYRQELHNRIAHYIVALDDGRTISAPPPLRRGRSPFVTWLFPWLKPSRLPAPPDSPLPQKYIAGFSGIWMMVDEAHITNLAVRTAYRGRGIGELLMIASIDLAKELNASFLTLEVRASNIVAQSLYRKYGFVQMGVRKAYYLDNREDAIIMSTDQIASGAFKELVAQLREALQKKLS